MSEFTPAACIDNNGITECTCPVCGQAQSHHRPSDEHGILLPFVNVRWFHRCGKPTDAVRNDPRGPGTELKKLLKTWLRIEATPTCSCNARARVMDERGIEWCEANIDQIVGWLREEATNRGLPFVDMAGRMLVRRAIKNAKKAAAKPPSST